MVEFSQALNDLIDEIKRIAKPTLKKCADWLNGILKGGR